MRAAQIKVYRQIGLEEVPVPKINDSQVLVKVNFASICGSDQHIYKGQFHPRTQLPLIPGHEFAGVIADTGKIFCRGFSPGRKSYCRPHYLVRSMCSMPVPVTILPVPL